MADTTAAREVSWKHEAQEDYCDTISYLTDEFGTTMKPKKNWQRLIYYAYGNAVNYS